MDPIRRSILATGVAATAVATAPARLLAQNVGAGAIPMGLYKKGTVRIHFEEAGSGFPLLVIAGGRTEFDYRKPERQLALQSNAGVQGGVPLHRFGLAQRQWRTILRPARGRPAVGRIHRRPSRPDGSPRHRQILRAGILHRRSHDLEPASSRSRAHRCGGTRAAERVASGDARPFL